MKFEQEVGIISNCYELLSKLDNEAKVRALSWLSSKFHLGYSTLTITTDAAVTATTKPEDGQATASTSSNGENGASGIDGFSSFGDMFKYLRPSSDAEKALAAAVYLHSKKNMTEISSAQVQKELKLINERVSNITQAISALVKKKLIQQIGKDGDSQQARKKYKVTAEATRTISELLKKR